uniref:TIL domain containing protein n=1 Tax=Rhipicephalus appendiculatus TaxID=34631 RepID=A0A131YI02_RHIAP
MKAAALAITLLAIAIVIQEATSRLPPGDFERGCPRNETRKRYVSSCAECRCNSRGRGERPRVCNMMLVVSGCFCDNKHCRTRDKRKCVLKSECY